jgi:hypothetical protein
MPPSSGERGEDRVPRDVMWLASWRAASYGGRGRSCSDLLDDAPCLTGVGQRLPRVAVRSPRAGPYTLAWFRERGKREACPKRELRQPRQRSRASFRAAHSAPPAVHGPSGGVERPRRADALRAIDATACPRSWRTKRSAPPAAGSLSLPCWLPRVTPHEYPAAAPHGPRQARRGPSGPSNQGPSALLAVERNVG